MGALTPPFGLRQTEGPAADCPGVDLLLTIRVTVPFTSDMLFPALYVNQFYTLRMGRRSISPPLPGPAFGNEVFLSPPSAAT